MCLFMCLFIYIYIYSIYTYLYNIYYPGEGQGNPLQNSYLENPMDRGNGQATVYRVAKSQTPLKQLSVLMKYIICVCNRTVLQNRYQVYFLHTP